MDKILYPTHPKRFIITDRSYCGKSIFLTNLILNIFNEYHKIYIYSPSLHQDSCQKLIKCFGTYIPIHIKPNILNEDDIDIVIDEIGKNKDFEKSDTEIETFDNIEELKYPQEPDDGGIIILDDLNEKEKDVPRVKAIFKRSRHDILSIFVIFHDYYELLKRAIKAYGNNYQIYEPNNFLDVWNIFQDKSSTDMTLNEFKYLISTCWSEKYQPLTIDMTKYRYHGRYRLGLNSIIVPNTTPFKNFNVKNEYLFKCNRT